MDPLMGQPGSLRNVPQGLPGQMGSNDGREQVLSSSIHLLGASLNPPQIRHSHVRRFDFIHNFPLDVVRKVCLLR